MQYWEVTIDRLDPDGGPGEIIARKFFETYDDADAFYTSLLNMQFFYFYDCPHIRPAPDFVVKGRDF